jgi:hypothetical protein
MRLHPVHYRLVLVIFGVSACTGGVWSLMADLLQADPSVFSRLLLKVHGAFAFLSLGVMGSMLPQHIRFAWKARCNVRTGLAMAVVFAVLVVAAYGLYYAPESLHEVAKWVHLTVGLLAVVLLPLHIVIGRRLRRPA